MSEIEQALLTAWMQRSEERIVASPEEHVAALAEAIKPLLGPSVAQLETLMAKWRAYESVSSNPGECDDDAFALGTEWGVGSIARTQLQALIEECK